MEDLFEGVEIEETTTNEQQVVEATDNKGEATAEKEPTNAERRKARADFFKAKAENDAKIRKYEAENKALSDSLNALGYSGKAEDILNKIESENTGKSIEEIKAQKQSLRDDIRKEVEAEMKAKYEADKAIEMRLQSDLMDIRAKFPEEKAKSVEELGEKFIALMATGKFDAVEAYEMTRPKEAKPSLDPKRPKETGKGGVEKDYISPSEARNMSRAEIKKYFDVIDKSREKWR